MGEKKTTYVITLNIMFHAFGMRGTALLFQII